jgi:hypothetical protein
LQAVTGLRADTVNPQGLGMSKVCSEDSVRRAFADADPEACAAWQSGALQTTWPAALRHPWILDLDVTVKPIYGHQEGAEGFQQSDGLLLNADSFCEFAALRVGSSRCVQDL